MNRMQSLRFIVEKQIDFLLISWQNAVVQLVQLVLFAHLQLDSRID